MFYDRKEYILYYDNISFLIEEPEGWKDDEKKYVRNEELHGIDINHSGALNFKRYSRDFLLYALNEAGVNAKVMLTKKIKDENEEWIYDYVSWVDFSTYKIKETTFEVKLNADPLTTRHKSKRNVKVELEREDTLSGKYIEEPLLVDTLYIKGRAILEVGRLSGPTEEKAVQDIRIDNSNLGARVMPLHLIENGDRDAGPVDVLSQTELVPNGRIDVDAGATGEMFLDVNETGAPIIYKLNFNHKQSVHPMISNCNTWELKCRIVVYSWNLGIYTRIPTRDVILYEKNGVGDYSLPQTIEIETGDFDLLIESNQSASIQWYMDATGSGTWNWFFTYYYGLGCSGFLSYGMPYNDICNYYDYTDGIFKLAYYESSLVVKEDTLPDPTTSKMLLAHEVGRRLSRIVLDTTFKSDLLGTPDHDSELYSEAGPFSGTGFVHGMWLRGLTNISSSDTYKPITTSFSDYFKTINVLYPCGIGFNNGEVRLEDRDFFYQKFIAVDLGVINPKDFEIEPDSKSLISLITISYGKEREYEDESGLDEYNRKTQYNTPLEVTDTELKLECKARTDSYGAERIRRDNPEISADKNFEDDNKDDDDNWIFNIHRELEEANWRISRWDEEFAKPPTGIYSQDTAMNLWYSPINVILRNGKWLKSGFLKELSNKIGFGYSDGNSDLSTQLKGGKEYKQSEGVPVADLGRASHVGKIANVVAPVTYNELNGTTDGFKNIYCLFSFKVNEIKYSGHIMSVENKNGIGTFKIKLFS